MVRVLRLLLPFALVALGFAGSTTTASAYGHADQPLAQVEISANCDNPSIDLCQAFGLGGIWVWVEIDADGTTDVAGAACGHNIGGPRGGAGSIRFSGHWQAFDGTAAQLYATYGPPPAFFVAGTDPNNHYYVLPELGIAVPRTQGHYGLQMGPGAQVQVTVAP